MKNYVLPHLKHGICCSPTVPALILFGRHTSHHQRLFCRLVILNSESRLTLICFVRKVQPGDIGIQLDLEDSHNYMTPVYQTSMFDLISASLQTLHACCLLMCSDMQEAISFSSGVKTQTQSKRSTGKKCYSFNPVIRPCVTRKSI